MEREVWCVGSDVVRRCILIVAVLSMMGIGMLLIAPAQANAEHLQPYPKYSHSNSSCYDDSAKDPLNVLFGGTSYGGYFGTQWGIRARFMEDLGWSEASTSKQWVKFQSNLGGWVIRQERDGSHWFEEVKGGIKKRYHGRLFRNKFATLGGSYAEKNCVTSLHHESLSWTGHVIDMDWEDVERQVLREFVESNPNNWYSYDKYPNGAGNMQGWKSNGKMSACTLTHRP